MSISKTPEFSLAYQEGYAARYHEEKEMAEELRQYRALGNALRDVIGSGLAGHKTALERCPCCERDFDKSSAFPGDPAGST